LSALPPCEPLSLSFNLPDDELEDTIALLIDHGANVNGTPGNCYTITTLPSHFPLNLSGPPLAVAIRIGRLRLVKILLKRGADALLQFLGSGSFTVLHNSLQLAMALHLHEIVDIILGHLLVATHGTVSAMRKQTGNVMVHLPGRILGEKGLFRKWLLHASHYREACQKTIAVCLKHGYDINGADENENTPLI
jgi:ankyrin repeat protein